MTHSFTKFCFLVHAWPGVIRDWQTSVDIKLWSNELVSFTGQLFLSCLSKVLARFLAHFFTPTEMTPSKLST